MKMMHLNIKKATPNDLHQLQKIGIDTFIETYAEVNTAENMKSYMDESFSVENLTTELHDNNATFYFALLDAIVVGYLKLNFGTSQKELQDENAIEIERIYVKKEFHKKKVGQKLYDQAIEIAQQKNVDYIWLGVWEKNPRAIHFYKKNGFVEFGKHIFKLGTDDQSDLKMKLVLKD